MVRTEVYIFYRLLAYCSCYYDINPAIALSGPRGVVPSNDWHISRGLLLCFNRYSLIVSPVSAAFKTCSPDA